MILTYPLGHLAQDSGELENYDDYNFSHIDKKWIDVLY